MFDKMKQLMEIRKQAERIKRELDAENLAISEVPGIQVVISGSQEFRSIRIDTDLLGKENKSKIEEGILRSINAAVKKSQNVAASKMAAVMPGLPGF